MDDFNGGKNNDGNKELRSFLSSDGGKKKKESEMFLKKQRIKVTVRRILMCVPTNSNSVICCITEVKALDSFEMSVVVEC